MLYGDKVKKKDVGTVPEPERKNEYQKKIEYVDIVEQCKCQYKNVGKVEYKNVGFSTYSSAA